ncbi:hypothetical protein [Mammaliicoccus sp. JADD-157]
MEIKIVNNFKDDYIDSIYVRTVQLVGLTKMKKQSKKYLLEVAIFQ